MYLVASACPFVGHLMEIASDWRLKENVDRVMSS